MLDQYADENARKHGHARPADLASKYSEQIKEEFKWRDIKHLPYQFWSTCISCFFMQVAINNYLVVASSVLQIRYGYDKVQAGLLFPMPYVVAAVASPIVGIVVDRFGHRNRVSLLGSCFMILAHVIIIVTPDCNRCWLALPPLVLLGMSYACYAVAQWGSLPYLVEARTLGTAFGICNVFENLATTVAGPILGIIESRTKHVAHGYFYTEVFYILCATLAMVFNVLSMSSFTLRPAGYHSEFGLLDVQELSKLEFSNMNRSVQSHSIARRSSSNFRASMLNSPMGLSRAKYRYQSTVE